MTRFSATRATGTATSWRSRPRAALHAPVREHPGLELLHEPLHLLALVRRQVVCGRPFDLPTSFASRERSSDSSRVA